MRRVKLVLLAALAITAFGVLTAAAHATEHLPSLLWLSNSEEVKSLGESTAGAQFNSRFLTIKATYTLVELFAKSTISEEMGMADLGTAKILFEGSEVSTHKCHTEGDLVEKGAVLIDNAEWHIVLDLENEYDILILVPETTIKCPGAFPETFKVKGSVLNRITNPTAGKHKLVVITETLCKTAGSREPKFKVYDNHLGEDVSALLLANGGLGFEEVCEELKANLESTLTALAEIMED